MTNISLKAAKREVLGKKVKQLRSEGNVPGNIYGKKIKSQAITISRDDLMQVYKDAGETSIVEIALGKKKIPTLIHDIQVHPVDDMVLHADFRAVDLTEKVVAAVPVELTGEAPAEKEGVGVLVQLIDEIEVDALPTDLPEQMTVDISSLEKVDDSVSVKDMKAGKKVEIKTEEDLVVAKIEALREEEELPVAPAAEEETPEDGQEPADEAAEESGEKAEGGDKEESPEKPESSESN